MPYIAAIDHGTTSSRCIIFNERLQFQTEHQMKHSQIAPHPGWLEHDPMEVFHLVCLCLSSALKKMRHKDPNFSKVDAVGIATQRETSVAWDKKSGLPLCNALVWSDARTFDVQREVMEKHGKNDWYFAAHINGLPVSTYFSAFKFRWMIENVREVQEAQANGTLMLGTMDSWLLWKLSNGKVHITDVTNASRTFLMDIHTLQWSEKLCKMTGVPMAVLPKIVSNSDFFCTIETNECKVTEALRVPTYITGCIGDQQSALLGNMCFVAGEAKVTYGTGCFLLINVGNKPLLSKHGLMATAAFKLGKDQVFYAIEGAVAGAGACVEWMSHNLNFFVHPREVETLCRSVPDTAGVVFVPAFSGLLAPYWDPTARGSIFGMTYKTNKAHIIRAALKAISMQVSDVVIAMQEDYGCQLKFVKVDGGLSRNRLLMEMQADSLGVELMVPRMAETTALGAALCAGLAVGIWPSLDFVGKVAEKELTSDIVKPTETDPAIRKLQRNNWERALKKSKWAKL